MKTVEIEVADDGSISVGLVPEETEQAESGGDGEGAEAQEADYMQPAKNLNEALQMARSLLTGNTPDQEAQADHDMAAGFNSVNGTDMGM